MSLRDRIKSFDFDQAETHDLAVLLEQVFMYHDSRSKDGGPIIVAQEVLKQFEESIRRRATPDLHKKVRICWMELHEALTQFETAISGLEKANAQTRS